LRDVPSHARNREEFEHPRREYYRRGYEWRIMARCMVMSEVAKGS
jgi:hypothetical protein